MENGNVVAWQLLLERADGARRRTGEEILRFHDRLDVRCHADARRHVLGCENGRRTRCRYFPDDRAGLRRRAGKLAGLSRRRRRRRRA